MSLPTEIFLGPIQKGVYHSGIKVFNFLPTGIKSLSGDIRKFKFTPVRTK